MIVITGSLGFIGWNLTLRFIELGMSPKLLLIDKRLPSLDQKNLLDRYAIDFRMIDLTNQKDVYQVLNKISSDIEIVYHLAANSDISSGIKNPGLDFMDTLISSMSLFQVLETIRTEKIRVVFASTSAVFGRVNSPITESGTSFAPISNYGWAKLASEFALMNRSLKNFNYSIVRFPNVVGPHMTHGVIFDLLGKIRSGINPVPVLGDGNQRKPYLHVSQLVSVLVWHFSNKFPNQVFNIGPDSTTSVREIVELMRAWFDSNLEFSYGTTPYGWIGDVERYEYIGGKVLTSIVKDLGMEIFNSSRAIALTLEELNLG